MWLKWNFLDVIYIKCWCKSHNFPAQWFMSYWVVYSRTFCPCSGWVITTFCEKALFLIVFSIFVPCFQVSEDSVSSVAIHHGLDDMVAIGFTSGSVYIFQLPSKEMGHSKKVFILPFYVVVVFCQDLRMFWISLCNNYFSTVALWAIQMEFSIAWLNF